MKISIGLQKPENFIHKITTTIKALRQLNKFAQSKLQVIKIKALILEVNNEKETKTAGCMKKAGQNSH